MAIGLTGFQLYSNGLAFTMVIRLRRTYRHGTHPIHDLIGRTTAPDSEPFLFGVQYADGRTATNVESGWPMNDAEDTGDPDRPLLTTTSGSGGDRSVDQATGWLRFLRAVRCFSSASGRNRSDRKPGRSGRHRDFQRTGSGAHALALGTSRGTLGSRAPRASATDHRLVRRHSSARLRRLRTPRPAP